MFELLVSPMTARTKPKYLALLAALFVTLGVFVSVAIPSVKGSVVVFAMLPAIPLFVRLLIGEERAMESELKKAKFRLFAYHESLFAMFAFFFLGSVIAYAFWSAVLPQDIANAVFADQIQEVERLAHPLSLFAFSQEAFQGLFLHNFWVLLLVFVFSLLYGIGSLYILLWNASLVGVFIGGKTVSMGISGFLSAVLALLPHGVFEVSAYFVASIAGGLLSAAIMRRHYARLEFRYVLRDVAILGVMAAILLVMAAIIESAL